MGRGENSSYLLFPLQEYVCSEKASGSSPDISHLSERGFQSVSVS